MESNIGVAQDGIMDIPGDVDGVGFPISLSFSCWHSVSNRDKDGVARYTSQEVERGRNWNEVIEDVPLVRLEKGSTARAHNWGV